MKKARWKTYRAMEYGGKRYNEREAEPEETREARKEGKRRKRDTDVCVALSACCTPCVWTACGDTASWSVREPQAPSASHHPGQYKSNRSEL